MSARHSIVRTASPTLIINRKEFDENRSKVVSMLHNVVVNVTYDLHDTLKKEEEEVDTKTE